MSGVLDSWNWQSIFLPSDTTPTTKGPVEIKYGSENRFFVRFRGSAKFVEYPATRENVSIHTSHTSPFGTPNLEVAEAVLETPDVPVPGCFLDLPGTQSTHDEDDRVVSRNLKRSDCFVFVLSAARSIDGQAVAQLSDLNPDLPTW